jgi:hypothetical protein
VPLIVMFGKVVVPGTWHLLLKLTKQPPEPRRRSLLQLGLAGVRVE